MAVDHSGVTLTYMVFLKRIFLLLLIVALTSCGRNRTYPSGLPNGPILPILTGSNVIPITVNGSHCTTNTYTNKPCVSVQICTPGTTTCQTINDLLLDTGSVGLRVFRSLLTITPTQVTDSGREVAECIQYGDGSKNWGPVQTVDLVLGGKSAVQIPIHVIDSTYTGESAHCRNSNASPTTAQYNGVLGVGVFPHDCEDACVSDTANGKYFTCLGGSCTGAAVALTKQVAHPVASQGSDNNGVLIRFPNVPFEGLPSVEGYLILGIDSQSNNTATGVTTFEADGLTGEMTTRYNGEDYRSIIDSGSNAYYFPQLGSIPNCASPNSGYDCPTSTLNLSATAISSTGSPTAEVFFSIGNYTNLKNSGNKVFIEAGANNSSRFNWGLPFFLGRNVYVGISGKTSSLGSGPYWAY